MNSHESLRSPCITCHLSYCTIEVLKVRRDAGLEAAYHFAFVDESVDESKLVPFEVGIVV